MKTLKVIFVALFFALVACGTEEEPQVTFTDWGEFHCPFGEPLLTIDSTKMLYVVEREGYAAGYCEEARISYWACESLSTDDASGDAERKSYIKRDPGLPKDMSQPSDDDYTNSGYDRGHLVPFADRKYSQSVSDTLFYWTNIVPQNPEFNQRTWLDLEEYVRGIAEQCGDIKVVTGALFLDDHETIGDNEVWVPTHMYKLIVRGKVAVVVVLPNVLAYPDAEWTDAPNAFWTVDELEDAANLNFMPRLGNRDASEIEGTLFGLEDLEDCED